jgi:hypothetical protein
MFSQLLSNKQDEVLEEIIYFLGSAVIAVLCSCYILRYFYLKIYKKKRPSAYMTCKSLSYNYN